MGVVESRRYALKLALAAPVALVTPDRAIAQSNDALRIVGPWEIGGLDPARSGYLFTRMHVTETLLNALDDGTPQPGLAQRWTTSGDGLTWRFFLRSGVRFHDGTALTADAVVTCLRRAQTPPALLAEAPITAIEAEAPDTVRVQLVTPFAALLAVLAHHSTQILAPASFAAGGEVRRIIGTGPYRMRSLQPPQQFELQAGDDMPAGTVPIRQVRYLAVGRAETRALMAESGQADLVYGLDPASLQRLRTRASVRVEGVNIPRTIIVKLNAGHPALSDVRVRRALSLAIDRVGVTRALLRDPSLAATQLFAPSLTAWHLNDLAPLMHDRAAAVKLLAEAGYTRSPDGLRDSAGNLLQLTLRTYPDRTELPIIATALQEQWRQVGLAVKVAIGNSSDVPARHRDGTLELALAARNYASVPDIAVTLLLDFGAKGGDWGAMNWRDGPMRAALAELARGVSSERAVALRGQVIRTLQSELPIVPVAWYRQHVAVNKRITGVSIDPLERSLRLLAMRWSA